jgi:predicted acylesterase/phospholipase RssA
MSIKNIAIACQGGGSHAAFTAGALPVLLPQFSNAAIAGSGGKHSPMRKDADEALLLTGMSGTSGGAISALLGWFGFLTGGAELSRTLLDGFWSSNCAQRPGERLFNQSTLRMADMLTVDLKFSPYLFPLNDIETASTRTWPMMTSLWPPLEQFVRPDYFQLQALVAPYVDFELVAALGRFCSVPLEIRRWRACHLQSRMFEGSASRQVQIGKVQAAIESRIHAGLASAAWIEGWIDRHHIASGALLRTAFAAWDEPACVFEASALDAVAQAVQEVTYAIPQLLIGAVDVESGAFTAFSSERAPEDAGITLGAVQASASLPWLFEATVIEGLDPETQEQRSRPYWDGLFSQNPPIKNFMSGLLDEIKKPDGVWVLQINQDQFDFNKHIADEHAKPVYGNEIWHRRDALSGNLSLNQEIAFIEAVNRRIGDPSQVAREDDKAVEVARIVMDPAAVASAVLRELGVYSKFDRDPLLKDALWDHGLQQAGHFLQLRGHADRLCDELAGSLKAMGAEERAGRFGVAGWQPGRHRIFGGLVAPDVLTLYRSPDGARAVAPQAVLRWHVSDALLDGEAVLIQGATGLCAEKDGWRLAETRLLKVEPKPAGGAAAVRQPEAIPLAGATEMAADNAAHGELDASVADMAPPPPPKARQPVRRRPPPTH